jgi:hypothetical protein
MVDTIKTGIYAGILSALLSSVPLFVMQMMQTRAFVYDEIWDKKAKELQLAIWRRRDILQVTLAFAYCTFCVLFTSCFLASIKPSVEAKWFYSLLVSVLKEFLFVPMALAIVYVVALKLIAHRTPDLHEAVQVAVGRTAEEDRATSTETVTLDERATQRKAGPPTLVAAIEDRPDMAAENLEEAGDVVVSPDASRRDDAAKADGSECGPLREVAVAVEDLPAAPTYDAVDPLPTPTCVSIDPPLTLPNKLSVGSSILHGMHKR